MTALKPRKRLTVDNSHHQALPGGEAVEDLISLAGRNLCELDAWVRAGGNINVAAGQFNDVTALHALGRANSGANGASGQVDRRALVALLDAGADTTLRNRRGETPFFCAVSNHLVWMVEEFCRRGLDSWNVPDNKGRVPLDACKDPAIKTHFFALSQARHLENRLEPGCDAVTKPGVRPRL